MTANTPIACPAEPTRPAGNPDPSPPRVPRAFGASRAKAPFSLQWAAGFVDGEGCIHVARQTYRCGRRATFALRVYIVQNDYATLDHFRKGVGIDAPIYEVRRTAQHNKQVYTLNFQGKKAMALILLLQPYLFRKLEEANAACTYWIEGRVGWHPGPKGLPAAIWALRERMYLKLRRLK